MVDYRFSQREYEKLKSAPGPVYNSQMYKRFLDWYSLKQSETDEKLYPIKEIPNDPRYAEKLRDMDGNYRDVYSDPFYYNQRDLGTFYKTLAKDPLYTGMFEAIGRVTIYASQFLQNPFAKFIKDPLMSGNAHMAGLFKDIKSHEWEPGIATKKFGVNQVVGVNHELETGDVLEGQKAELYDIPDTGWLFRAETPEFVTTVSRINFSREIALLVNAREYARYCQTPEMVGEIGSALMGMSNAIYMNDMREASKNFFCGVVRIDPKHEPLTISTYGEDSSTEDLLELSRLGSSSMVEVVEIDHDLYTTEEARGNIIADGLTRKIHNTLEVDFADFSDKYNPSHLDRIAEKCTVVLDSHVRYDTFKKYYASLHHPEFIKPGPQAEFIWINEFPKFATDIFANKDDPTIDLDDNRWTWYELVCMIVDDNALAIIPYQTPVTVQTFFNPHKESMSIFTHYQCDFEFKPFFNRKYIYLKHKVTKRPIFSNKIKEKEHKLTVNPGFSNKIKEKEDVHKKT